MELTRAAIFLAAPRVIFSASFLRAVVFSEADFRHSEGEHSALACLELPGTCLF